MFTSVVPPNAARYLGTKVLARRVPVAHLELMPPRSGTRYYFNDLKKDEMLGIILSNKSFDSSLIKYDSNYFTTTSCDEANQVSLLKLVMAIKPSIKNAFEIGCGQGEFVELLRKSGIDATGCDPVFRGCQPGITATTFEQSPQQHSNLFILRCVLPHLERPFELIDKIFELNPQSQILFTFPNISWIFKTGTWASLSHDHVHYFSLSEIGRRYQLLRGGKYSAGEWSFCLIRSQNFQLQNRALNPDPEKVEVLREKFRQLQSKKDRFMKSIELEKRRIVIWGGAGKGAHIGLHLSLLGIEPAVVDLDQNKHDKFMECSGLKIVSPNSIGLIDSGTLVLVANMRHEAWVRKYFCKSAMTINKYLARVLR